MSNPPSAPESRSSTPAASDSRFLSQNATAEDLLKDRTVGLVQLSDYRKRRAEVIEEKGRAQLTPGSQTPSDRSSTPQPAKKKRKNVAKAKLSFGLDDDDDEDDTSAPSTAAPTPRSRTPDNRASNGAAAAEGEEEVAVPRKRLAANASAGVLPKAMTKSALLRGAQAREQLRKDYLVMQEQVKAAEIAIPFVFYDGTKIPGGVCRVKKGDHVWLFLDKARKVGAELSVGGDKGRREWARVSVDDLMLVRGEIIVPHHHEFYHFIANKTQGFNGVLFDYSAEASLATATSNEISTSDSSSYNPLSKPGSKKDTPSVADKDVEGYHDDPNITKVVDRRWYERNKHIFPASIWEEFDPTKDYTKGIRKDGEGNSFFF